MSKAMFITVGTSLFESATWQPREGKLPGNVPYYVARWIDNPEALKSPDSRRMDGRSRQIRESLMKCLREDNTTNWAHHLPEDLRGQPNIDLCMRYSAELSTLLKLFDASEEEWVTFGEFLDSYSGIFLLADSVRSDSYSTPALTWIAASHISSYLNLLAGRRAAIPSSIPGLSSNQRRELLDTPGWGLQRVASEIRRAIESDPGGTLDLVLSGGYKIYGVFLARLLDRKDANVRIHYIHEQGDRLLTVQSPQAKGGAANGGLTDDCFFWPEARN